MADGYWLTDADRQMIIDLKRKVDSIRRSMHVHTPQDIVFPSTDCYIAYTPSGGIPALGSTATGTADDVPGCAECQIYKFRDPLDTTPDLDMIVGLTKTVFNLSTTAIAENQWVPVIREKSGAWIAIPLNQGSGSGGSSSSSVELKGLTFTSDTDSTADSDPGAGLFKWNNATQSSATALYFDDQTESGAGLTTFWASLGPAGLILLQQGDDSTKWQVHKWTATPVDGTGYRKFTTVYQTGAGSIADAKTVYCLFLSRQPFDATETVAGDWNASTQTLRGGKTIKRQLAVGGGVISISNNEGVTGVGDGSASLEIEDGLKIADDLTSPGYLFTILSRIGATNIGSIEWTDGSDTLFFTFEGTTLTMSGGTGALVDIDGSLAILNGGSPPSAASDPGRTGQIAWDANYIYICTATDTWKRVAIATW